MRNKNIQNLGLKIIALLFAIILWFIVVNIDDPVVSSVYRDIPITVKHEEVISNQGKVYRIKDDVKTVNVTVSAQRSVLSKIKSKDIVAVADLSQMEINTFMVPINASVRGLEGKYQSAEANPRNLQIGIDNVTKNKFPISVNATGTPRDGFIIGEMTANPEKVEIGGPEPFVNSIAKAVAKIDVTGLSESAVVEAELVLYDLNGNVINQMPLTNNFGEKGLSVNVELLRTKNVDLNISVSGKPAEGYVYSGWSSKPEKIQVCGTKEVLSNLNTIEIPASAISIEGASASKEVTIDIEKYLPQDVSLVDESGNKIAVKLLIEKEDSKTIELFPEAVQIKNLSENLKAELIEGKDLELSFTGDEELLRVLDIRDAAFIDLKNYTRPGKYSVPVTIETVPGVTLLNNPTVTVLLTEKKSDNE